MTAGFHGIIAALATPLLTPTPTPLILRWEWTALIEDCDEAYRKGLLKFRPTFVRIKFEDMEEEISDWLNKSGRVRYVQSHHLFNTRAAFAGWGPALPAGFLPRLPLPLRLLASAVPSPRSTPITRSKLVELVAPTSSPDLSHTAPVLSPGTLPPGRYAVMASCPSQVRVWDHGIRKQALRFQTRHDNTHLAHHMPPAALSPRSATTCGSWTRCV